MTGRPRRSPPELRGARPTVVYDSYWRFAAERQEVFFRKLEGRPAPWTDDPIIARHKFTNAYRASDRVSQFLIRHVIYEGEQSPGGGVLSHHPLQALQQDRNVGDAARSAIDHLLLRLLLREIRPGAHRGPGFRRKNLLGGIHDAVGQELVWPYPEASQPPLVAGTDDGGWGATEDRRRTKHGTGLPDSQGRTRQSATSWPTSS